jgi:tellurite resistance protein TehA-like permease
MKHSNKYVAIILKSLLFTTFTMAFYILVIISGMKNPPNTGTALAHGLIGMLDINILIIISIILMIIFSIIFTARHWATHKLGKINIDKCGGSCAEAETRGGKSHPRRRSEHLGS